MPPVDRADLRNRLNPDQSISIEHALRLLDLPEQPRDLSAVIDRARSGLADVGRRHERFQPYCEQLVSAFDSITAIATTAAPENFRHTVQASLGATSRSSGLRRSNPWHSVLLEEVARGIEPSILVHLFGIGSLSAAVISESMTENIGSDSQLAKYSRNLLWVLEESEELERIPNVFRILGIDLDQTPAQLWALEQRASAWLLKPTVPKHSKVRGLVDAYRLLLQELLRRGPGTPISARQPKAFEPFTVEDRAGIITVTGEGTTHRLIRSRSRIRDESQEPATTEFVGASPDTPANTIESPLRIQRSVAAEAWRMGKDISKLTPFSWGRLCSEEIAELRQRLTELNEVHPAACAATLRALALGGPGESYQLRRELEFRDADDGFRPPPDQRHLYRQQITRGTLRIDGDAEDRTVGQSDTAIEAAVGTLLSKLGKSNPRITPNRIARVLPAALLDESGDRTLVETLFASSIDRGVAAGAYAAYKQIGSVYAPKDDPPAIIDVTGTSLHVGNRVREGPDDAGLRNRQRTAERSSRMYVAPRRTLASTHHRPEAKPLSGGHCHRGWPRRAQHQGQRRLVEGTS